MKEIKLSKTGTVNNDKVAYVDDDIFPIVNQYNWTYTGKGYAKQDKILHSLLHVYIWKLKVGEIPEGYEIDHINQNKLDCRISNLRLATHSENMCNRGKNKNNKSGFKNIFKETIRIKRDKGKIDVYTRWKVKITKGDKRISKGFIYHNDEEKEQKLQEAIAWQKEKEKELHQKYAFSNRPENEDK